MNMIECPECRSMIPEVNRICPHCGFPLFEAAGANTSNLSATENKSEREGNDSIGANAIKESTEVPKETDIKKADPQVMADINMWSLLGILAGIFAIIAGLYVMFANNGMRPDYTSFGGDAYTYIYSAARQTAINTDIAKIGVGALLIFGGTSNLCKYGPLLKTKDATKKKEA